MTKRSGHRGSAASCAQTSHATQYWGRCSWTVYKHRGAAAGSRDENEGSYECSLSRRRSLPIRAFSWLKVPTIAHLRPFADGSFAALVDCIMCSPLSSISSPRFLRGRDHFLVPAPRCPAQGCSVLRRNNQTNTNINIAMQLFSILSSPHPIAGVINS